MQSLNKKLLVLLILVANLGTSYAVAEQESEFNPDAAWNEFEQLYRLFYAYIDREDFSADDVVQRMRDAAANAESAEEFRQVLSNGLLAWTDPHLQLGPVESGFNVYPTSADLVIRFVDGAYVVRDVRSGSDAARAGVRPGWSLLEVESQSVEAAVSELLALVTDAPTARQNSYAATLLANGRKGVARSLSFEQEEGESSTLQLPSPAEYAGRLRNDPILSATRIGEVAVISVNNSLGNNDTILEFDRVLADNLDASGIVIDLRNTPSGGNTEVARSILGHFVETTRSYQVHEVPSLEREFTVPRRFIEQVMPREPAYLDNPVVVLGGHWTGSMGEGLVIGFDAATDAHIFASDMGDLLGGMYTLNLSQSQAYLLLGRESLFHVDGTPREDFVAEHALTQSDTAADGSDPAMRAALEYINSQ